MFSRRERERTLVYVGYREGRDRAFDFMPTPGPRCRKAWRWSESAQQAYPSLVIDLPDGGLLCLTFSQNCLLPPGHAGWCRFRDERATCVTSADGKAVGSYHDLIERLEGRP